MIYVRSWVSRLGAMLLGVAAFPLAGALVAGCGCDFAFNFTLHATVVDATTGQPIPAPVFVDSTTGQPIPAPMANNTPFAECETPDAGVCPTWMVQTQEHGGSIAISAPGYVLQSQPVPTRGNQTCPNDGDNVTQTYHLVKRP